MIGEFWDYGKSSVRIGPIESQPVRLLLVEDRRGGLEPLADYLRGQAGMKIDGTSDSGLLAGVRAIFDTPDVVLVSADLVGFNAWDTVRLIKQLAPAVSVLVIGRNVQPCGWLRHNECPDAIVEESHDFPAIVDRIRSLRAGAGAASGAVAALQTRSFNAPDHS